MSSAVAFRFLHISPFDGAFFSHFSPGQPSSWSIPLPSSSTWQRRFSSRNTEPGAGSAHAASTSAPQQSARKVTGLPSSSARRSATGLSVSFADGRPSGRPRCDISTTDFAPPSSAILIDGIAPTIRWLFVMFPSLSCGTLKSTRISTRLPETSASLSCFLLRFMVAVKVRFSVVA